MQHLVPFAQRFGEYAGPGGPLNERGEDAAWWIVSILIIALLATIAGLLAWLARRALGAAQSAAPGGAAFEALDLRLAQGEITPEDYRARRDVLAGVAPATPVDPEAPTEVKPG
ncbi:MAG: hypothetical protein MUC84_09845 [Solirubrobacteraceae bacterium]|jgi:uncharacterized membrane protein|nr:hypothetical protein [Solirubrobacteraceae bacterium]MCU0314346.1 hypothetical protein [Solirubrobacteraceae bacterium]